MHRLRKLIARNWLAKVFSIVIATVLWITISMQANSEIGISIPLEYRNIPSQLEVIGDTTNNIEVRLRGPAALIREVSPRDISATVDLTGLQPGEKIVQLTPQNVKLPFGVDVVRVNPSQVRLDLERTMSKSVPVVIRLDGEPARGYEIDGMSVAPSTVTVEGPESKVRNIESIPTAIIRTAGRTTSYIGSVDLDLPDPMLRLQSLSPVQVRINIQTRERRQQ